MEGADIKRLAQSVLGHLAQFDDPQFTDHVGGRLSGHRNVPLNRSLAVILCIRRVGYKIGHRLLPGPLLVMQAGIDHQTRGSPQLHRESAKVGIRILIKTHFLR